MRTLFKKNSRGETVIAALATGMLAGRIFGASAGD
jgi:hypothetical protein